MHKKRMTRFLAGVLSAAMLMTSTGMEQLVYAAEVSTQVEQTASIEEEESAETELDESDLDEDAEASKDLDREEIQDEQDEPELEETPVESDAENVITTLDEDRNIASGVIEINEGHVEWVLDKAGKLTVTGEGDCIDPSGDDESNYLLYPWYQYKDRIKSAEVSVKKMTTTVNMFYDCNKMEEIDFTGSDTSQVTNMHGMFMRCENLEEINFASFSTEQVEDISDMFYECANLKSIDLAKFNTQNVTNMRWVFRACSTLKSLDLNNFNTSNVKNMQGLFEGCSGLTSLDLSNFNTEKAVDMSHMFQGCASLMELDLGGFDTSSVETMYGMFSGCSNLTNLNISYFDTAQVEGMSEMFLDCSSLKALDLSNWDMRSAMYVGSMFSGCENLEEIIFNDYESSSYKAVVPTYISKMFYNCRKLKYVDLSQFNFWQVWSYADDYKDVLTGCDSLERIEAPIRANAYATYGLQLPAGTYECWSLEDGTEVTAIPRDLVQSVTISKSTRTISTDSILCERVREYTSDSVRKQWEHILNSDFPDDIKMQLLAELFNQNGYTDITQGVQWINDCSDKVMAYNALVNNEMYCAYNFAAFMESDSGKAFATNLLLAMDGMFLNGEIDSLTSLDTYISGDYPIIKDYKAMLLDFMQTDEQEIFDTTYISLAKDWMKYPVKVATWEKPEYAKKAKEELEKLTIPDELKAWEEKWNVNIENIQPNDENFKKYFKDTFGGAAKGLSITCDSMEAFNVLVDLTARYKVIDEYQSFLQTIVEDDSGMPIALRAAAKSLSDELENKWKLPLRTILGTVVKEASPTKYLFRTEAWITARLKYKDVLALLSFSSWCTNALLDMKDTVKDARYALTYGQLSGLYQYKLVLAKRDFLDHPNNDTALNFYNTYTILWKLRVHGETSYCDLMKIKGLAAWLMNNAFTKDKSKTAEETLKSLETKWKFQYTDAEQIRDNTYYEQKIMFKCPVTVSAYTLDGDLIVCLENEETDIENEYGRFISLYQPETDDYAKILYFNDHENYKIEAAGQDSGFVSYEYADRDNVQKAFQNISVEKGTVLTLGTQEEQVSIKQDTNTTEVELSKKGTDYVAVTDLQSDQEMMQMEPEETASMKVKILPVDATYTQLLWNSDNEDVVTVQNGKITAIRPGDAVITVYAEADLRVQKKVTVKVAAKEYWVEAIPNQTYTSNPIRPTLAVYDHATLLKEGRDYTLSYKNNTKVGTAQVILKGKGDYTKTITVEFQIVPKTITSESIRITVNDQKMGKSGKKIVSALTVTDGKKKLKEGTDYQISFGNYFFDEVTAGQDLPVQISGIGNYTGETEQSFHVYTSTVSGFVADPIGVQNYTGQEICPKITVYASKADQAAGKPLTEDQDYTISYQNNIQTGTGKVQIHGLGNYGGTKTVSFKISAKNMAETDIMVENDSYTYTGSQIRPAVTVKQDGRILNAGTDYTVTYKNNVNVSEKAEVIVKGKGNYTGTITAYFAIIPKQLNEENGIQVTVKDVKVKDDTTVAKPIVIVMDGIRKLREGKDYQVNYGTWRLSDELTGRTPVVYVTGVDGSNYLHEEDEDWIAKTFHIYKQTTSVADCEILLDQDTFVYTGSKLTPAVTVLYQGETLQSGKDYQVTYKNNINVPKAGVKDTQKPQIVVSGKGRFKDKTTLNFEIRPLDFKTLENIDLTVSERVYTGKELKPAVDISFESTKLKAGKDFVITGYQNNICCGEKTDTLAPTVTIEGKENYMGTLAGTFRIYEKSISKVYVEKVKAQTYTGDPLEPELMIRESGKTSDRLSDNCYEVRYENNVKAGIGHAIITGTGAYGGTKKVTFIILPRWLSWLAIN